MGISENILYNIKYEKLDPNLNVFIILLFYLFNNNNNNSI